MNTCWYTLKTRILRRVLLLKIVVICQPMLVLLGRVKCGFKSHPVKVQCPGFSHFGPILLMEEILHHLGCIKPCKLRDIYHINWCRISSINSMALCINNKGSVKTTAFCIDDSIVSRVFQRTLKTEVMNSQITDGACYLVMSPYQFCLHSHIKSKPNGEWLDLISDEVNTFGCH